MVASLTVLCEYAQLMYVHTHARSRAGNIFTNRVINLQLLTYGNVVTFISICRFVHDGSGQLGNRYCSYVKESLERRRNC